MKKYVFPALLLISGCCLSFLMVQPNKTGLIILAIGVLCSATFAAYCYKTSDKHDFSIKKRSNLLSVLFAAVIVGFVGFFDGGLPTKYGDSGLVSSVFEKIGIDKTAGLTVLAVIMCLLALPGVYAFFVFLQENSDKEDDSVVGRFFSSNAFFYSCFTIGLLLCGCLIITSFSYSVTNDDVFSLQLIKRDFARLTVLTANDFHPPLYYYLLKIFVSVFSFTGINEIFLGKLFSVIPYLILIVVCFVCYRKTRQNGFAYGISILLFACFWCTYFQTMQIRMYTWGMLFVTLAFFEAKWLIEEGNKKFHWILLAVYSLLCCYTQYFAAVAAVMIYGMIGLYFLINQRKLIWKLLVSGIVVVVGYAPWIVIFLRQLLSVQKDKTTIYIVENTIANYYEYFLTPAYEPHRRMFVSLVFIMLLTLFFLVMIKCYRSFTIEQSVGSMIGILLIVLVALFGDIVSLIGNPILLPRYLFMSLSVLIVTIGFIYQKSGKRIKVLLLFLLCLMVPFQLGSFISTQSNSANKTKEWRDIFLKENINTIYVEEQGFGGRAIKQVVGVNVETFIEEAFSAEYEELKERYSQSTIDCFDMVVYGDQHQLHRSQNCEYLINVVKENGSAVVVFEHPEIVALLENTGTINADYLGLYKSSSKIFRLTLK